MANTYLKIIIKYSTYGESPYIAATGTIVRKSMITEKNYYFLDVRAGEDIDWLIRVRKNHLKFMAKKLAKGQVIFCHL